MASSQLVFLGGLTCSYQVAQRLVCRVRHPDLRQLAGAKAARKLDGVAAVGLDPVTGLLRDQRRCHDVALHAHLGELPVQRVARRPGLVAGLDALRSPELVHELPHRLGAIGNRPQRPHLSATAWLGDRDGDRLGVDIEPDESCSFLHDRSPSHVALRHGLAIEA